MLGRWEAGLKDRNPRVRAAAARAANVSNATSLLPGVTAALEKETDAAAGTEEIRATMALGGEAGSPSLLATAQRLGPWAVTAYAGMLARVRGRAAMNVIASLDLPAADRQSASNLATGGNREAPLTGGRTSFLASDLSPACEQAGRAALLSAFGPTTVAPRTPQIVVAVMAPDVFECLDARSSDVAGGIRLAAQGTFTPPRKIRDLNPRYPSQALADRTTGTVIGESTINESGCTVAIRVTQFADPLFAVASIQATSGWRYTPSLVNGMPVAVRLTWVTNFQLQ